MQSSENQSKKFFTVDELAKRWSMSPRTLNNWRYSGKGLPYIKMTNKVILYDVNDVESYETEHRVTNTVV